MLLSGIRTRLQATVRNAICGHRHSDIEYRTYDGKAQPDRFLVLWTGSQRSLIGPQTDEMKGSELGDLEPVRQRTG